MPEVLEPCCREVCLGTVDTIPLGEGCTFRVEGERIAVFRQRDGSLFAVQSECPHQGGPLAEGLIGSCTVICPLHSWKFDLATGECAHDPSLRLRTYAVREQQGRLMLRLG